LNNNRQQASNFFFRQDLQDLHVFLFYFQFPEETENTQSAFSGNKPYMLL